MSEKRVYTFGNGQAEGNAQMRERLGGKGANLAEMNLIGIPVPPGFTIATDVCNEYYEVGQEKIVEILQAEVNAAVAHVENLMNSKFQYSTHRFSLSGIENDNLIRLSWRRSTLISFSVPGTKTGSDDFPNISTYTLSEGKRYSPWENIMAFDFASLPRVMMFINVLSAEITFKTGNNAIRKSCAPGCTRQLCHTPSRLLLVTS